jgi:hypothetical protein
MEERDMILDLYFSTPQMLWAIPFILLLGAFIIRKISKNRLYAATRLLAFCLIIAAAANPYFVEVHTVGRDLWASLTQMSPQG